MLTNPLLSIFIGLVLGFLTGLGTGGGSLLMLWLTLACNISPNIARQINLMFFLPCATTAIILNLRKGHIQPKQLLLPCLCGCISAAVISIYSKNINTEQLQKLFGVLLLYTGVRELIYRPRKPK